VERVSHATGAEADYTHFGRPARIESRRRAQRRRLASSSCDRVFVVPSRRVHAWALASTHILCPRRAPRFSSDRAIRLYAEEIWGVSPVPVRDTTAW